MAMNINEIRYKYKHGGYTFNRYIPDKVAIGHVFDEELSVKRNRELVQEHNDNIDRLRRDKNRIQDELNKQLTYDVVVYIMTNYGFTERQAKIIESFVYQHYHYSMDEYFSYIEIFADFAEDLLTVKEENYG